MELKPGDKVYIRGTIQRVEILPHDVILYYCKEKPEIPFTERDLIHAENANIIVDGIDEFSKKLEEFGEAIERARTLYEELTHLDMKINLSIKNKGELVTTELAHIFTSF